MSDFPVPGMLYHFTHRKNRISIDHFGLLTSRATLASRIWFCDITKMGWAIRHVAQTHDWQEKDMVCICVQTETIESHFTRHRPGVYFTTRQVKPWSLTRNADARLVYLSLQS